MSGRGEDSGGGQLIAFLGPPFEGSTKFGVNVDDIYSRSALFILFFSRKQIVTLNWLQYHRLIPVKAPVAGCWMAD